MVNYALMYGKSAFTLAKDLGVPPRAGPGLHRRILRPLSRRTCLHRRHHRARAADRELAQPSGVLRNADLHAGTSRYGRGRAPGHDNRPCRARPQTWQEGHADLHRELHARGMGARRILQIHDELLLEVPERKGEKAGGLVKDVMEGALRLEVPVVVDARLGTSWAEVH